MSTFYSHNKNVYGRFYAANSAFNFIYVILGLGSGTKLSYAIIYLLSDIFRLDVLLRRNNCTGEPRRHPKKPQKAVAMTMQVTANPFTSLWRK